jgi:hypoxanthine-guanine phosphoribosyltransferase
LNHPPVLISEQDIQARVAELAAQISADYGDKGDIVLVARSSSSLTCRDA